MDNDIEIILEANEEDKTMLTITSETAWDSLIDINNAEYSILQEN